MRLLYHLAIALLVFMTAGIPAVSQAESVNPQTLLVQNTPTVSQEPQAVGGESAEGGVPALNIPQKDFQFENVPAGQTVIHDFVIRNQGTAVLGITRVKSG